MGICLVGDLGDLSFIGSASAVKRTFSGILIRLYI